MWRNVALLLLLSLSLGHAAQGNRDPEVSEATMRSAFAAGRVYWGQEVD